jgi:hypothetical protein
MRELHASSEVVIIAAVAVPQPCGHGSEWQRRHDMMVCRDIHAALYLAVIVILQCLYLTHVPLKSCTCASIENTS